MAGRFLSQNLASSRTMICRSRSLLLSAHHAPACARDVVAPLTSRVSAAKCFSTMLCARVASVTGSSTSGLPSATTLKPAFVKNSVGVKQTFSSNASTKDTISPKPKVPTSSAAQEADMAAWKAHMAAYVKQEAGIASFVNYWTFLFGAGGFIMWDLIPWPSDGGSSHCCSNCCKCQCAARNHNDQQSQELLQDSLSRDRM